jgi:hypothetical protein
MKFEVEVYRKDTGEWVATAVEHQVSVTALSEQEALMRLLDALGKHLKGKSRSA